MVAHGSGTDPTYDRPVIPSGPLLALDRWPVERAAAAIVTADGVVAAHGDVDEPFALASVTKPLFASALLVAVEEEVVGLDDPAGPRGATVRHLLAHASGLGLDGGELARPGRRRIYSNAGYDALGHVLHRAADLTPDAYLAEAVIEPLGLSATELRGSPASGGRSSVTDLARWLVTFVSPGALLAPGTVTEATTVAFPGLDGLVPGYGKQSPNDWGLGFEIRGHKDPHWTAPGNSPATFGHFGRAGTFVWVDPALAAGLIVLTDREFGDWCLPHWPAVSQAVVDHLA